MIQVVNGLLVRRLARRPGRTVRSEAHVSSGITKPSLLDWVRHAQAQAARFKPDVTVVFLGANDGFPLPTPSGASVACCAEAWVAAYARRVEATMLSLLRGGVRVIDLTRVFTPGGRFRQTIAFRQDDRCPPGRRHPSLAGGRRGCRDAHRRAPAGRPRAAVVHGAARCSARPGACQAASRPRGVASTSPRARGHPRHRPAVVVEFGVHDAR